MDKQREARQAQARERRAARELQHKARMERWLQQQEERQQQVIARHEAMRNQAEEEHNFLVQNHDDMLQKALQEKIDVANRHEEKRKEADQRRKKFAAFRAAIKDMTPTERREYMDKHREDLFSGDASDRPPAMPAAPPRFDGMYSQPPVPPWYR
jgi:myosin heavy subunit